MDRSQLLRGALDAAALAVVAEQDGYGYDVVRRLRGAGLTDVGDASVYGTLRRLYRAGALTSYVMPSDEGPHRRYYGITQRGRDQLDESRVVWADFSAALTQFAGDHCGGDRVTTTTVPPELDAYLSSVREALDDLPDAERDDLLAEVEDSLLEAATERSRPDCGTARAAARTSRRSCERQRDCTSERRTRVAGSRINVRELLAGIAADGRVGAVVRWRGSLRPCGGSPAHTSRRTGRSRLDADGRSTIRGVPRLPTAATTIVLLGLAVAASVWLGLRTRGGSDRLRRYALVGNLVLVAAILPVYPHLIAGPPLEYVYVASGEELLPGLVNCGSLSRTSIRTRATGNCSTTCCSTTVAACRLQSAESAKTRLAESW